MQTQIKARLVASGIQSPHEVLRLIWSDGTERCNEAAWAALTKDFKSLTAAQIQQRLAAEGIEIALDAAADLQIEAITQRPCGVVAALQPNNEHASTGIDVGDGAGLHSSSMVVPGIVAEASRERAAALIQAAADARRTKFIFITCMLEAQQSAQVLQAKREQLQLPTKRRPAFRYESPLIDALWAGYIALKDEADRCAKAVRERGQLLCAFEGTTVLDMQVPA